MDKRLLDLVGVFKAYEEVPYRHRLTLGLALRHQSPRTVKMLEESMCPELQRLRSTVEQLGLNWPVSSRGGPGPETGS